MEYKAPFPLTTALSTTKAYARLGPDNNVRNIFTSIGDVDYHTKQQTCTSAVKKKISTIQIK